MKAYVQKKGARYYVCVEEGLDPATGKRKRTWHSGYKTRKEASSGLQTILSQMETGAYVPPTRLTVADFLTDEWLPSISRDLRPGTIGLYETLVRAYVTPRIGGVSLQSLRVLHLNELYDELLATGGHNGRPLSPKSVRNVHTTLHRALRDAVRWGRLARNPAALANPPRAKRREMRTWTAEHVGTFLGQVREDRLYAAWLTLATTGLRRGELLGLRWGDVDLSANRLAIRRGLVMVGRTVAFSEPKTAKGRRTVPIPAETFAAFREHRKAQLEERLALGPGYSAGELVFCREDGTPLHPETFARAFSTHARTAGLPVIRLHDMRHTFATLALRANVPAKAVAEILGHASVAMTLDTYSHVIPAMQEEAATKVAALIFPGGSK